MGPSRARSALATIALAVSVGLGGVGMVFVALAAIFLWGMSRPVEEPPASPLTFPIRLGWSPDLEGVTHELHLDGADVDALDLPSAVVEGSGGSLTVESPLPDYEPQRSHCLLGSAEIIEPETAGVIATIPAGTCIGRRAELVVPTPNAPAFDVRVDQADPTLRGEPIVLAGTIVVHIDGCSTIDGQRVIWPHSTGADESGSLTLLDGTRLINGSEVTVQARAIWSEQADVDGNDRCSGGPGLFVEAVG